MRKPIGGKQQSWRASSSIVSDSIAATGCPGAHNTCNGCTTELHRCEKLLIGGGWPSQMAVSAGSFDPAQRPLLDRESLIANLRVAADVILRVADLNLIRTHSTTA